MRTVVIVQARFASTRLPGKTMLSLGRHTVLREVVERCRSIDGVDAVCCAVSDGFGRDIIAEEAERAGAVVSMGSDVDVLERYRAAAELMAADVILRVTSDCPLIDPAVCAAVLGERAARQADYCADNVPPSFPHGLDCEAFTRAVLERAAATAEDSFDREHVTPWICRAPDVIRAGVVAPTDRYARQRWTLDHPEDYAFLWRVFSLLGDERPGWASLAERLVERPDVLSINVGRIDAARFTPATR